MGNSDTRIHHRELLLTLDYLLNHTDENNPATYEKICRHGEKYGLKYDSKIKRGNDVDRKRIAPCLKFLKELVDKYPDSFPFVLKTTEANKYYIESKYYLNKENVLLLLSIVSNDKYTNDDDTNFLIEKLLDVYSNEYNRSYFIDQLKNNTRGTKKVNTWISRKFRLVNKAYKENKTIVIRRETFNYKTFSMHEEDVRYRVYAIKEFKNQLYAVLIPISQGDGRLYKQILFDKIENLNIPSGRESDIITSDFDDNRDLNREYMDKNTIARKYYDDIDDMLDKNIMPQGGLHSIVSFYFKLKDKQYIEQSYEQFFSTKLEYTKCAFFDVLEGKAVKTISLPKKNDRGKLKAHELKVGEEPIYGVANVCVNTKAFTSWLLSEPDGFGYINIADLITVVNPAFINHDLAHYYAKHMLKYKDYLDDESKNKIKKYNY